MSYKVTRYYSSNLNKTVTEVTYESPDSMDKEVYTKTLDGNLSQTADTELIKLVLDQVRIKLNPDEAIAGLVKQLDESTKAIEEAQEKILNVIIHISELTYEQREGLINQYPTVAVGDEVEAGRVYNIDGVLYEAIKSTSIDAENWIGDESIFKLFLAGETEEGQEIIHDWKQPAGEHDTYNIGDKVRFDGKVYESVIDGNVWSPADNPQGWEEV